MGLSRIITNQNKIEEKSEFLRTYIPYAVTLKFPGIVVQSVRISGPTEGAGVYMFI